MLDLSVYSDFVARCYPHTSTVFLETSDPIGGLSHSCSATKCIINVPTDAPRYVGGSPNELTYSLQLNFPDTRSTMLNGKIEV